MKCPTCRKATMKKSRKVHRYNESGLSNVVLRTVTIEECPACGERLLGIDRLEQLHEEITHALVFKLGRLTPEEIRFLRKRLDWSGAEFARQMHATPYTVSNWETGKQDMGEKSDLLFRALVVIAKGYKVSLDQMAELVRLGPTTLRLEFERGPHGWKLGEHAEREARSA